METCTTYLPPFISSARARTTVQIFGHPKKKPTLNAVDGQDALNLHPRIRLEHASRMLKNPPAELYGFPPVSVRDGEVSGRFVNSKPGSVLSAPILAVTA